MFRQLEIEVMDRFTAVEAYFKTSGRLHGVSGQVAKGLAFVHVYAAYEFAVCGVVQCAITTIGAKQTPIRELGPHLSALFLDPEMRALKDCNQRQVWRKRFDLLERATSQDGAALPGLVVPSDGSHFRHTQLELIYRVLGINRTPARRRRHLFTIDEIVEHRNAIAHGREPAEAIGRRYSRGEIRKRVRVMRSVCICLIVTIEQHCSK